MQCSNIIREEKEKLFEKEDLDNITYGQFTILDWISILEKPTITALSKAMNMSKPTVTIHIQKMERIGLVYKEKSYEDRRVSYIRLSEKGKRVEMAEQNAFKRIEKIINEKLTDEEQKYFSVALNKLLKK
ncbi:MarR family winged helix-turn-helix transcriptional regulator [Abyssisolibacter fermentans]|uniref:MarR family winged helix-turn-helix transcriptional regulator n=1 Tax=Abyssisolibacter fermentans TaxID=1766203 RepID=UPI00138F98CA|nr:MarR family winged helix-turn-helix transcriptional regulator [Abyssisolibacter fermentans]